MSELEPSEGKPNLVPMLDMVFQLITFFMLVINFKTASLDRNLLLPAVGSARPVDTGGRDRLLVLNLRGTEVVRNGQVVMRGDGKPELQNPRWCCTAPLAPMLTDISRMRPCNLGCPRE